MSRARIWIVDDSRLESEHLRRLLAPAYEVESFSEGATALERLQENAAALPDVLVLDWEMPGLSGTPPAG